jgi:IS5 family transposase
VIDPVYPKAGNGRPPIGVERMLRIYFLQQWFNLSDPAVEEALYDSRAMHGFVGIDLGREPVPDETTVCRFRHLLEVNDLGRRLFDEVQRHLAAKGLKVATGTIVDATIINAPSSTKNVNKARDPEMHQTKKGNQWYFGMKAHLGVDSRSKLIHAVAATPANTADSTVLPDLLHGQETRVWGDQAYRGQRAVIRQHAPKAQDFTNRRYRHRGVVDENRAGEKSHQVENPGQGRTFDRGHQAGVWLCQGALSRAQQEHPPSAGDLRFGQFVHRAPPPAASLGGVD